MTKKLGLINKFIYGNNIVFTVLLLVSFVLPFVPPKEYPNVSLLSLVVSPLIVINILFVIYWVFKLKPKAMLSIIVLVFAYFHFGSFFKISSEKNKEDYKNTLSVLSYNVRLFNAYEKEEKQINVPEIINNFIEKEQPEVLFIQEFYTINKVDFLDYPYQYIHYKKKNKLGHAIFSKYPLIHTNSFDFEHTYNNSIYADVVKGKDTIRVYNLHLQSLSVLPSFNFLQKMDSEILRKRITERFVKQQTQVEIILKHKENSNYPVIICGDFNNTPFSYVYHKLSENMNDAFEEAGNGLGTTFLFENYPMRIDYILSSKKLEVLSFETIGKTFSDHYPITATLGWN
ncbi:MAG: endonuclease/exonuclease/phosphatase family protein [Flavobacteriaceae bacterium]|nr:endonuclease/exonuclease/phosphatase family protein [Flavobacteriaceae bacterium]